MNRPIQICLLLCLLSNIVIGQNLKAYEQKAQAAHAEKDFSAALAYEKILIEIDSNRVDALYRGGEAAMELKVFEEARDLFERIPAENRIGDYLKTDYYLGLAKKSLAKYEEAISHFQAFVRKAINEDSFLANAAKKEIENCQWALANDQPPANVEVKRLGDNVNTIASDFAPYRFAEKLYFSSAYPPENTETSVVRIFSTVKESMARLVDVNTKEEDFHSSHSSLTLDGQRMYFTICENGEHINEFSCQIYYRDKGYDGSWSTLAALPRHINLRGYTTTQPSIAFDRSLGKEVLYFASNRPGGYGGMDVWVSEITEDLQSGVTKFEEPYPLPFNTEGDDITPFFHYQSQQLYFSSNGIEGLGGFDIYHINKDRSGVWSKPENIGAPVNSSYDDLYYTFHSSSKTGYFASNRPGAKCADPEKGCNCNDIYSATYRVDLQVRLWDRENNAALNEVKVELLDLESGKIEAYQVNATGNQYSFPLELDREYLIKATLGGYNVATAEVNTMRLSSYANFEQNLFLKRKYGQQALGVAPKESDSNTRSFEDFSKKLDLPLELYFDNDQPLKGNVYSTQTNLTYGETYAEYLTRKPVFYQKYIKGLKGIEAMDAKQEIRSFFRDTVEASYARLQKFCADLESYLRAGNQLEISIAGYASPLADEIYNARLTSRRIQSVENHIAEYGGGIFSPYLVSGSLKIKREPRGEYLLKENVSDDNSDERNSIYSPTASRLRRVTITEIRQQN